LWQDEAPLNCETIHAADLEQAVNELQTNQVRYVIVAQSSRADFASYFQTIQPIYEDSGLAAYSMESIMGAHWCQ
jgi:hypothetical protein